MYKVDPSIADVHHTSVSVAPDTGFLGALAVAVSFMLLAFAAEFVWKHVPRPVAAVLAALAVTVGVLAVAVG